MTNETIPQPPVGNAGGSTTTPAKAGEPAGQPPPAMTPLQATLELARRGKTNILPQLRKVLDEHPGIWRHYGDVAGIIEKLWIQKLVGEDLLLQESIVLQLDALRQQLGGANRIEKLIVERIVAAWLEAQHAQMALSQSGEAGIKIRLFRLKALESAERRFQSACRNLAVVRRLLGGVELHVQHTHSVVAPPEVKPPDTTTPSQVDLGEMRRNSLFGKGGEPLPVGSQEVAHV